MSDLEPNDQARVKRAAELKEYRLASLPGWFDFTNEYQDEYPALVAHLEAQSVILHPDELNGPHDQLFKELWEDTFSEFEG